MAERAGMIPEQCPREAGRGLHKKPTSALVCRVCLRHTTHTTTRQHDDQTNSAFGRDARRGGGGGVPVGVARGNVLRDCPGRSSMPASSSSRCGGCLSAFGWRWRPAGQPIVKRHSGHVQSVSSQRPMHASWKKCSHGSRISRSSASYPTRHNAHVRVLGGASILRTTLA